MKEKKQLAYFTLQQAKYDTSSSLTKIKPVKTDEISGEIQISLQLISTPLHTACIQRGSYQEIYKILQNDKLDPNIILDIVCNIRNLILN